MYNNDQDIAHLSIPLLIRLLEFAREDAKSDLDLHFVVENIIREHQRKPWLNMEQYKALVTEPPMTDQPTVNSIVEL